MVIRHPDRVTALVLLMPLAYKPNALADSAKPLAPGAEAMLMRLIGSDLLFWVALHVARDQVIRYVLATPHEQVSNASPEEREAYRKRLRQALMAMSPEDRQALASRARERWQDMSPQQREQFRQERGEKIRSLSEDERKDLLEQRRAMLEKLSPEERAALREKLPSR